MYSSLYSNKKRMASSVEGSFEPDFVDPEAAKEFTCSICLSLAVQPRLNPSCGHHYCHECADSLVKRGSQCPECRADITQLVPDLYFERKMKQLEVRCCSSEDGCQWVGQLSELQSHLKHCEAQEDCEFSYAGCQAKLSHNDFPKHMQESLAIHVSLLSKHVRQQDEKIASLEGAALLLQEELQSSNGKACELIEKARVEVRKANKKVVAQAEKVKLAETNIEGLQRQLTLLSTAHEEAMKANERVEVELRKCHLRETKFQALESRLASLSSVAVPNLVMTSFGMYRQNGTNWYSPPFYSHIGGYKLCLRVMANGQLSGAGTHVSVFVHLMRGENDNFLWWPFQGHVTLCLVNHRMEQCHIEKTVSFSGADGSRVTDCECSYLGQGFSCFAAHTDLPYNSSRNTEYLSRDSLTFRLVNVKLV